MNVVKEIDRINQRELDLGIDGTESSSWHYKYRDSAYIFVGNLDYELTEGDILCVFSQFGVKFLLRRKVERSFSILIQFIPGTL
jgi:RNA-binding motif protein, X-linked 2